MNIPCVNCLVFPMCKARVDDHSTVFNSSAMFSYIKNRCSILRDAYYEDKDTNYIEAARTVLPYAQQKFCKKVLNIFK